MFDKIKKYISAKYVGVKDISRYNQTFDAYSYFVSRFHKHPNRYFITQDDNVPDTSGVVVDLHKFDDLIGKHYNGFETISLYVADKAGKELYNSNCYVFKKQKMVLELNTALDKTSLYYLDSDNVLFEDIFSYIKQSIVVKSLNNSSESEESKEEGKGGKLNVIDFNPDGTPKLVQIDMNDIDFIQELYDKGDFDEFDERVKLAVAPGANNMIILYGPSGMGKTSYVKHLIKDCPDTKFIHLRHDVLDNLCRPDYLRLFASLKDCCVIVENAEKILRDKKIFNVPNSSYNLEALSYGIYANLFNISFIFVADGDDELDEGFLMNADIVRKFDYLTNDEVRSILYSIGYIENDNEYKEKYEFPNDFITLRDITNKANLDIAKFGYKKQIKTIGYE